MSRAATGLADLLHALHATPPARWPDVAAVLGWAAADPVVSPPPPVALPVRSQPPADQRHGTPATADPVPGPGEPDQPAPRQVYWRIASHTTDPEAQDEAPAWLQEGGEPTEAEFEGDLDLAPPPAAPLVRPGQVATFLRRHLVSERPTAEVDLASVVRSLVRQQPLSRVPRCHRRRWPSRVQLVYDRAPALGPLQHDLRALAVQAGRLLGPRLVLRVTSGEPGGWCGADGAPATLPVDGGPVLVLGDAGLALPGSAAQARWVALGRRLAAAGCRPLLLAPLPRRLAQRDTAAAYDTVLLGSGRAMRVVHAARLPVAAAELAAPPLPAPPPGAAGPVAAPSALAVLRTALHGNPWVTPALLRALRLALQAQGLPLDAGHEAEVWRDPAVGAHAQACTLLAEQRAAAARDWAALPAHLQAAIVVTHHATLRTGAPLLLHEYTRAVWPLMRPGVEAAVRTQAGSVVHGMAEAEAFARRACAALWRRGGAWTGGIAAFIARLGQRRPEIIEQGDDSLQAAWLLAQRDGLQRGSVEPLPGLRLARLGWALGGGDAGAAGPHLLTLAADTEGGPSVPAPTVMQVRSAGDTGGTPGGPAVAAALPSPWTQVAALPSPGAPTLPVWLPAGARHALPAGVPVELRNGAHILVLAPFTRPDWARAVCHDQGRWQAQAPDGRWLTWVPACAVEMRGLLPQPGSRAHAPAAWWDGDAALQHTPPAHRVPFPAWASQQGIDEFGLWAEFRVEGRHGTATQRLRWLPAGEFWMGSPEEEPERRDNEQRHRVLLTQGLWLADTACTQALWQAVLGENPSSFSDDPENPVEQVSWLDITQRFLPALNALVPGLQATLPTEAQWEYACRAGTDTPFWFGRQVTTAQVNYDGNYPYDGGPQGEYRERTVPVQALPANGWGLYQMHGNVLEWCADEMAEYGAGPAVNPLGSTNAGESRAAAGGQRVLRGGSWFSVGGFCRSALRVAIEPVVRDDHIGFRLVRGLAEPGPEAQAGGAGSPRAKPAGSGPRAERGPPPEAASRPQARPTPSGKGGRRR